MNKHLKTIELYYDLLNLFENEEEGIQLNYIKSQLNKCYSYIHKLLQPLVKKGYLEKRKYTSKYLVIPHKNSSHYLYFITPKGYNLKEYIGATLDMLQYIYNNITIEEPKSLNSSSSLEGNEV